MRPERAKENHPMTAISADFFTMMKKPQDAMTESDKQYLRSMGLNPDAYTVFDLFEQMKSRPYPTNSRQAVDEHYAVVKRVLDICRETSLRAVTGK
jgi:hypothetical protein